MKILMKVDDACGNVAKMARDLQRWSNTKFGDFAKETRACKTHMGKLMEEPQTTEIIDKMRAIDMRMDKLETREEIYWK